MSTFKEKKDLIIEGIHELELQFGLDELVDKSKAYEATAINNEGIDSQLSYLFQQWHTVEDIRTWIQKQA